jgi:orotate phosphoribosyltransferase-like protein
MALPKPLSRARKMKAMRRRGMTDVEIAKEFGLSRERVGQIIGRRNGKTVRTAEDVYRDLKAAGKIE